MRGHILGDGVFVHHGVWYNNAEGLWLTTLTNDEANYLLAVIALYVTFYSQDFWYLLRWILHAHRYRDSDHSTFHVLHHQMQVALRNSGNPGSYLFKVCMLWWHWRRVPVVRAWRRCLPDVIFSTIVFGAWILAGIFIANALEDVPKQVLLSPSSTCGLEYRDWSLAPDEQLPWLRYRETLIAKTVPIVDNCFLGDKTGVECLFHPALDLNLTGTPTSCPLADSGACIDTPLLYELGPLSSREHLGIDTPRKHEVLYRRSVTCSPIDLERFATTSIVTADQEHGLLVTGSTLKTFNIGPHVRSDGEDAITLSLVNKTAVSGYFLSTYEDADTESNIYWQPKQETFPYGGNWNLFMLRQPGVRYTTDLADPFFRSTTLAPAQAEDSLYYSTSLYMPDDLYTSLVCVSKHKFCKADDIECTDWIPLKHLGDPVNYTSVDWNPTQLVIVERIVNQTSQFSMSSVVQDLGSAAIAASGSLIGNINIGTFADTQWHNETRRWTALSFAALQYQMAAFVKGFGAQVDDISIMVDGPPELKALCSRQRVGETGVNTRNFYMNAILAVFLVGIVVNGLGLLGGKVNDMAQRLRSSDRPRIQWAQDGLFQLHRRHLELADIDGWVGVENEVPVVDRHVTRSTSERIEITRLATGNDYVGGKEGSSAVVMSVKETK